jgi:hypothetical protein
MRRSLFSPGWVVCWVALVGFGPAVSATDSKDADASAWLFNAAVDARLRYERVDDDAVVDEANATTLRTRFSLTARRSRFGALLEFEDVSPIGSERFNDTANGRTNYAVVADPEATEVNRAWLSYAAPHAIHVKAGRQVVNRDRGRIIGHVGWRQNQQSFDAVTAERNKGKFRFWSGYLARANRIFGDQHPNPVQRQFELDAWVGEGAVHLGPGTVTGTLHYIEFENDPTRSHRNLGLRWVGSHALDDDRRIEYRAEWIDQGTHANGAAGNDAEYYALEAGYETRRWGIGANLEQLSGDGMYGFQRPLATLHAYNGWADRFLSTPAEGLIDLYVDARLSIGGYVLKGEFHDFDADSGSLNFGNEIGFSVSRKFLKHLDVVLKYAGHDAGDVGADVHKIWVSVRILEKFKLRRDKGTS